MKYLFLFSMLSMALGVLIALPGWPQSLFGVRGRVVFALIVASVVAWFTFFGIVVFDSMPNEKELATEPAQTDTEYGNKQ